METIKALMAEIEALEKKSILLGEILKYWDKDEMTFIIPEKWEGLEKIREDKKEELLRRSPSPRHKINDSIYKNLPFSESDRLVNWSEVLH